MSSNNIPVIVPLFDPSVIEQYRKEFSKFDSDKNGTLDQKEFIQWMKNGGSNEKTAKVVFKVADSDRNGTISFDEFANFANAASAIVANGDMDAYLKMVFKAADKGNKEYLDMKGFKRFMKYMNSPVNFLKAKKAFKEFDEDKDGKIEFWELSNILNFQFQQ